jgi:methylenetetrahydrofolate dehydrogenase (NADP+)/methenyltetrahydrofolate cyclohydrolase
MVIFDGKSEAEKILHELKEKIEEKQIEPCLAVISIDPGESSLLYIKNKKEAAGRAGIKVVHYNFSSDSKEDVIIKKINELNNDSSVNGIIVQLPLPKEFNADKIINFIDKRKDADGFLKGSYCEPVLSQAILLAWQRANDLKGDNVVALTNSDFFGKNLELYFKKKGLEIKYILRDNFQKEDIQKADVLITACGCPGIIKDDIIKEGVVIIDAGITKEDKKILGDAERGIKKPSFITPVPGGIGPLTVALLLKNTYLTYGYSKNN